MDAAVGTVGIIGFGRFGRSLGELMSESGIRVRAFDPHAPVPEPYAAGSPGELVRASHIVVLAVPVPALEAVIDDVSALLTGGQTRARCRQRQDEAGRDLRAASRRSRALGGHAPAVRARQPRAPRAAAARRGVSERSPSRRRRRRREPLSPASGARSGCRTPRRTTGRWPRTHALGFLIAKAFIDLGVGGESESVPPSFRGISATIESVREDAGHLFTAILNDNPFAAEATARVPRHPDPPRRATGTRAGCRIGGDRTGVPHSRLRPAFAGPGGGPGPHRRRRSAPGRPAAAAARSVQACGAHQAPGRQTGPRSRAGGCVARRTRRVGPSGGAGRRGHAARVPRGARPVARAADQAGFRDILTRCSHPCTTGRCRTGTR